LFGSTRKKQSRNWQSSAYAWAFLSLIVEEIDLDIEDDEGFDEIGIISQMKFHII
jgi:hypothetical protein